LTEVKFSTVSKCRRIHTCTHGMCLPWEWTSTTVIYIVIIVDKFLADLPQAAVQDLFQMVSFLMIHQLLKSTQI